MRVAVTGSSGLIGSALVPALRAAGHDVLPLVRRTPGVGEARWDPAAGTIDTAALAGVDAIVNLAGENLGKRWTARRRRRVVESRVRGTRLLAETAAALEPKPALLAASAVGYYGDRGDEELTEASSRGTGFMADTAVAWEEAAEPAREAAVRVVQFRQGMVLSRRGGALRRMLLPFRLGLGGTVGSGRQWWSWVAIDDVVAAYQFALERPIDGIYNLAAPGLTRNSEFVRTLGKVLRRPTVVPAFSPVVRLLFGQMGDEVLLRGQRVRSDRVQGEGFTFRYPQLEQALERALRA
jgi:uncharacterized protein (TIGR01777 family)